MLLLAAMICAATLELVAGGRLDCRCVGVACACLAVRPRRGDRLCVYRQRGRPCATLDADGSGSSQVRLSTTAITVANPECKCGGRFCACIVSTTSEKDRICLNSFDGLLCKSVQKATDSYGLVSRLEDKESRDSCRCYGDACTCNIFKMRPESIVCLHSSEQLSCVQLAVHEKNETRLTMHDGGPACSCSFARCTCKWGAAGRGVEVCVYSAEGTVCRPHPRLHVTHDGPLSPPPTVPGLLPLAGSRDGGRVSCACSATVCGCRVVAAGAGDAVCWHSAQGVRCTTLPLDQQPSRVLRPANTSGVQPDCLCLVTFCVCIGMQPRKHDQICLYSSSDIECHPMQTTGSYSSLQPGERPSCRCDVSGPCTCSWRRLRAGHVVCLRSAAAVTCLPARVQHQLLPLSHLQTQDVCSCRRDRCYCKWRQVARGDEVCWFWQGGVLCGLVADRLRPGNATLSVLRRSRRGVRKEPSLQDCVCSGGVCTCTWMQASPPSGDMCIVQEKQKTCYRVQHSSSPQLPSPKTLGCSCGSTQCVCNFGRVMKGAKTCLYTPEGTYCTALSVLNDDQRSAPWLEKCVCSGGVCSCAWMRGGPPSGDMCLVQDKQKTCYRVQQSSSPPLPSPKSLGCSCWSTQCVCKFGRELEDAQICFYSAEGTACDAPKVLDDENQKRRPMLSSLNSAFLDQPTRGYSGFHYPLKSPPRTCDEVGGTPATVGIFLDVVLLQQRLSGNDYKFVCSGTLISPQKIVTSARCLDDTILKTASYVASVPALNRAYRTESTQVREVTAQYRHPEYHVKDNIHFNDVAVLLVKSPFVKNGYLRPMRMDVKPDEDQIAFVTGWGIVDQKTEPKNLLHFELIRVLSSDECRCHFPEINDGFLCVTSLKPGSKVCVGDLGSGVTAGYNVIGLVSSRYESDSEEVMLLTNVPYYKNFIDSHP